MNMNFDDNTKTPGRRSLSLSNRAPDEDTRRAHLDAERVLPTTITDLAINPGDVLCGRRKLSFNHPGNRRFRDLVGTAVTAYNEAESRLAKASVVNSIVEEVRSSGVRFLRRDEEAGKWHGRCIRLDRCRAMAACRTKRLLKIPDVYVDKRKMGWHHRYMNGSSTP